jgi:hypothetical protein
LYVEGGVAVCIRDRKVRKENVGIKPGGSDASREPDMLTVLRTDRRPADGSMPVTRDRLSKPRAIYELNSVLISSEGLKGDNESINVLLALHRKWFLPVYKARPLERQLQLFGNRSATRYAYENSTLVGIVVLGAVVPGQLRATYNGRCNFRELERRMDGLRFGLVVG